MSTASWTSASDAPAAWAAATSAAVSSRGSRADGSGDVEEGLHLGVEAVGRSDLDRVDQRRALGGAVPLEERRRERAVRIHAVEAIVRGRDGGGEHLPLGALDRRAREVVDEQLVGEAAQVDAEDRRQPQGGEDPGDVRQSADDRIFLGALEALRVACHVQLLRPLPGSATQYAVRPRRGRRNPLPGIPRYATAAAPTRNAARNNARTICGACSDQSPGPLPRPACYGRVG